MIDITRAAVPFSDLSGTFAADDSDPTSLQFFAAKYGIYRRVVGLTVDNWTLDPIPVAFHVLDMDLAVESETEDFREVISRSVAANGGEMRVETFTTEIPRKELADLFQFMMTRAYITGIEFDHVSEVGCHALDQTEADDQPRSD
jgi:hypothetical protein